MTVNIKESGVEPPVDPYAYVMASGRVRHSNYNHETIAVRGSALLWDKTRVKVMRVGGTVTARFSVGVFGLFAAMDVNPMYKDWVHDALAYAIDSDDNPGGALFMSPSTRPSELEDAMGFPWFPGSRILLYRDDVTCECECMIIPVADGGPGSCPPANGRGWPLEAVSMPFGSVEAAVDKAREVMALARWSVPLVESKYRTWEGLTVDRAYKQWQCLGEHGLDLLFAEKCGVVNRPWMEAATYALLKAKRAAATAASGPDPNQIDRNM